jgi:hypothetical protein
MYGRPSHSVRTNMAGSVKIHRVRLPLGSRRRCSLERRGARRTNREDHLSAERLVLHPNNSSVGFLNVVQRA